MPENIVTRVAVADDAAALARLRFAWGEQHRERLGSEEQYADELASWLADSGPRSIGRVVEGENGIEGMAWMSRLNVFPSPTLGARIVGEIHSVFAIGDRVDALAEALVEALISDAREKGFRRIEANRTTPGLGPGSWVAARDKLSLLI